MVFITGLENTERDAAARKAIQEALESIHSAAQAESEATAATIQAARLHDELAVARVVLERAQQGASDVHTVLQGLYQHAAAFRTMQRLTKAMQDVKDGASARDWGARAKRRHVVAAEGDERELKAEFDASAEAFRAEQETVAGLETGVQKAEQV